MASSQKQLLEIRPEKALYFEGPFTEVVTSHIQLSNIQDHAVCFKVKTTVPKRYCVRPSSGVIKSKDSVSVAVMLQPFDYDPAEKTKHKFMIQSMMLSDGDHSSLDQLWKEADASEIMDLKLICVLRRPGELLIEPGHELMFDGPLDKPLSATIQLSNPSANPIYFKLHASSTKVTASPGSAVIQPGKSLELTVRVKPMDLGDADKPRERIMIKSVALKENETPPHAELLETDQATSTALKCLFSALGMTVAASDTIKPVKQTPSQASAPLNTTQTSKESLLAEMAALRSENKALKDEDIRFRRTALSDTCRSSAADGGAAIGRHGALGAIASVPPILYLILALLIGLLLGKFAL